jgi:hypothetical protein
MKNKQKYTPVRFSHLMSHAGVGSIVRGSEDKLMVVTDIRYWTDRNGQVATDVIPYVTRVTMALNIDKELRMPPSAKELDNGRLDGSYLPAVIFPVFAKCQKCGLLHNNPWRDEDKKLSEKVYCKKCNGILEQVTWCAVSNKGHLGEVPWHYICHQNSSSDCRVDFESSYMRLITDSNGRQIVKCDRCGSKNYYENTKINFIYSIQPWIKKAPKLYEDDVVEILEVNNPAVYLPESVNALVIPPESRISKASIVDKLYNNSKLKREIESERSPLRKRGKLKETARELRCSVEEVISALKEIEAGYPYFEKNITVGELIEDEYKAFLTPLYDVRDDEDFVVVHKTNEFKELSDNLTSAELNSIIQIIDNHVIATRLREIQVFKGFYRGKQNDEKEVLLPPDIVGKSDWLPAIELFGEGLFFTLNEDIISKWESITSVKKRADEISKRYENSNLSLQNEPNITPRFILLHTLSHLLIRELESTAGYPAASLKERIYCSKDKKMAGILIYTSIPDIVGSLGGIIESAEPKNFLALLDKAFKHAQWCSLDPVCTEHEGQGPGWLNRAACHACCLIPELSCDHGNVFLDRTFIKGNVSLKIPNFLNFVMENNCD